MFLTTNILGTKPFHTRTKNLASDLKQWRKRKKPLDEQLASIEHQLLQQQNLSSDLQNYSLQATLHKNHQTLFTKDVAYHRQRVKKLWATDGDRNTQFF